jgi:hypothetical protein
MTSLNATTLPTRGDLEASGDMADRKPAFAKPGNF